MLAKRIIPCLDIKNGQTVKGINFEGLREVGDPVEMGAKYAAEGADELVYLDISASLEGRKTFTELVTRISEKIDIPFTPWEEESPPMRTEQGFSTPELTRYPSTRQP